MTGQGRTEQIQQESRGGVRILRLDRPVANALTPDLRSDLLSALRAAAADVTCRAVVIGALGPGFSSGVDLAEHDGPPAEPTVEALCHEIEDFPKPVVVALHGAALGAAVALAVAAHARVAQASARIGLPEITLGMIPGGGVSQRLPRLAGAGTALEIMLSGQSMRASDPRLRDLLDQVVAQPPEDAAVALAIRLAEAGDWQRSREITRGLSDPATYQQTIAVARQKLRAPDGAAADIVRAVEAAQLLPFEQGLTYERVLVEERITSPEASALRHLHAAERRAGGMPELRNGVVRPLRRVSLLGDGLGDVAIALLEAGREVAAQDPALPDVVREYYARALSAGRLDRDEIGRRLARLVTATAGDPADLLLDGRGDPNAALPVMPGAIRVRLDTGAGLAGARLGLRLYRPATMLRAAEIAVGPEAEADEVASLARLCAETGRSAVRAALPAAGPGLGHALQGALDLAALQMLGAGLSAAQVDGAAERLGLRTGPLRAMDQEGPGVAAARLAGVAAALGLPPPVDPGPAGQPEGDAAGTLPGGVAPEAALHGALVNAAARLLSSGAAQRASDLDVIAVRGLGYDRAHGGPLWQADRRGLLALLKDMKALAALCAPLWAPQPMIADLVKNGEGFFGRVALPLS